MSAEYFACLSVLVISCVIWVYLIEETPFSTFNLLEYAVGARDTYVGNDERVVQAAADGKLEKNYKKKRQKRLNKNYLISYHLSIVIEPLWNL